MQTIAAALVKAQQGFGPALKTASNPHLRTKYADLAACVEAVIDALHQNGIALMQPTHECENGVIVETLFLHESGESISAGKLHVPASKQDAQGYGSALTYARRYSLMAACCIAPEPALDDDGHTATPAKAPAKASKASASAPAANGPELLTADEVANVTALAEEIGKPIADICKAYKVSSLNFIPRSAFSKIIARLEAARTDPSAA